MITSGLCTSVKGFCVCRFVLMRLLIEVHKFLIGHHFGVGQYVAAVLLNV